MDSSDRDAAIVEEDWAGRGNGAECLGNRGAGEVSMDIRWMYEHVASILPKGDPAIAIDPGAR